MILFIIKLFLSVFLWTTFMLLICRWIESILEIKNTQNNIIIAMQILISKMMIINDDDKNEI